MYKQFSVKPNGIPVLSYGQIDQMAESMINDLQPEIFGRQIDKVDLNRVLRSLDGWRFYGKYLSATGFLLGAAVFKEGYMNCVDETRTRPELFHVPPKTILVDKGLYERENEFLFRFTFGHEVGHAILHEKFCSSDENMRKYAEQGNVKAMRDSTITFGHQESHKLTNERDWVEWQANAFSSAMLMPKTLVFRIAAMVEGGTDYVKMSEQDPLFPDFLNELCITLSDVFRVSETVAFYRIKLLEIAPQEAKLLPNGAIVV